MANITGACVLGLFSRAISKYGRRKRTTCVYDESSEIRKFRYDLPRGNTFENHSDETSVVYFNARKKIDIREQENDRDYVNVEQEEQTSWKKYDFYSVWKGTS